MHKIIFLNGPPRSGKDTAATYIAGNFRARSYKMSRPLKRGLAEFYAFNRDDLKEIEDNKDKKLFDIFKQPDGNVLTWREVQISLSEAWAKKVFGPAVFGMLALRYLDRASGMPMTVISDAGFVEEVAPIIKHFRRDNCLGIQLSREGCTFENDSRSYVDFEKFGVTTVQLDNKYPLHATDEMPITYQHQICKVVRDFLGEEQDE